MEWREIPGFSYYLASSLGVVYSKRQKKEMCTQYSKGYQILSLHPDNGKRVTRGLHQLIALAFLGPKPKGEICRHLDGDKNNCRADNLAWGTPSQNRLDDKWHGKGYIKVSVNDAARIKKLIAFGFGNTTIANRFNTSMEHINRIRRGYCHADVEPVLFDTKELNDGIP